MAETVTWINVTPNTPDTAYDWSDPDNWEGGKVGGEGDDVTLPNEGVYIRVPDSGITVRRLHNLTSSAYLFGGDIRLLSSGEGTDDNRRAQLNTSAKIYCDIVIPQEETISPYLKGYSTKGQGYQLCASVRNESTAGIYPQVTDGSDYHNFSYFAKSAGAERTENMVSAGPFGINGGATFFMAPEGGAAVSGSWKLTEGSVYATRSSSKHDLAVGTAVSGQGLPEGTFLKRVFNDATIELSKPATQSGTVTLSFAAMDTDFTLTLGSQFLMHGNYCNLFFYKKREANNARLEILDFNTLSKFKTIEMFLGNNSDGTPCGTFVFHKVSGKGRFKFIDIRHAHLEFAGDETGVTAFSDDQPFEMPKVNSNALSARFTVTNNIIGVVSVLSNFHGSITKDGGGFLQLGLGENIAEGVLVAEGGTLKLVRRISTDAGTLALSSLTIKSGATVELPEGGLTVSDLVVEDGATLSGDAKLTVLNGADRSAASNLTCEGGATVTYVFEGGVTDGRDIFSAGSAISVAENGILEAGSAGSGALGKEGLGTLKLDGFNAETLAIYAGTVSVARLDRASAVPAGAWLHVDATEASSITLTNSWSGTAVHSWADVNGTGRELRSIRQQRDINSGGWPIYNPATKTINNLPCVDLGNRQTGSSGGLVVFEADGKISPGQDALIANMQAPRLRTNFLVYDSTAGGGALMGGVGSDFAQKGIPHRFHFQASGEAAASLHTVPICSDPTLGAKWNVGAVSNACVNGTATFLRNGESINPCTEYFNCAPELMAFKFPAGLRCAVFGAYGGSGIRGDYFGGLKYGEIICFERNLSDSEFNRVHAYLAKKWFNRKVPGYGAPSATNLFVAAGSTLTLLGDDPITSKFVAGGGTVEGSLSLSAEGGIEVEVAEGGAVPCLTFTGSADLSNGGVVQVTGHLRDLEEGDYMLLAADAVVIGGEWSLEVPQLPEGLTMSLSVTEAGVQLRVRKKGTIIIVR